MKGTVVWFNESKGIGYIKDDESGEEISAHFTEIKRKGFRTLYEGERVSYSIEKTKFNALKAVNIELIRK